MKTLSGASKSSTPDEENDYFDSTCIDEKGREDLTGTQNK